MAVPIGPPRDPVPYQDWARTQAQTYLDRRSIDDPATFCRPQSGPRMTPTGLFPIQFVQSPKQIAILYEYFWLFRPIPIDGRTQFSRDADPEPSDLGPGPSREDRHQTSHALGPAFVDSFEIGPSANVLVRPKRPCHRSSETVRRFRPLARRRFSTWRPSLVAMRTRNPWVFLRRRLFG